MNIKKFYEMSSFGNLGMDEIFVIPSITQIKEASSPYAIEPGFYNNNTLYKKCIDGEKIVAKTLDQDFSIKNIPNSEIVVRVELD